MGYCVLHCRTNRSQPCCTSERCGGLVIWQRKHCATRRGGGHLRPTPSGRNTAWGLQRQLKQQTSQRGAQRAGRIGAFAILAPGRIIEDARTPHSRRQRRAVDGKCELAAQHHPGNRLHDQRATEAAPCRRRRRAQIPDGVSFDNDRGCHSDGPIAAHGEPPQHSFSTLQPSHPSPRRVEDEHI